MLFNAPLITDGVVNDSSEGNTFYLIRHDYPQSYSIACRKKINIQTKIADTPICCPLPNNNKSKPWKTSSEGRLN